MDIFNIHKHLNSIEQYLRINNIEIIGLPEPSEEENNEELLLKALNSLENITYQIVKEDIDISHPIPSRRKDEKRVSVCRFVSRKTKYDVLEAKKKAKNFKYKDNDIYINEHLSPVNRRIFGEASVKRKELQYKHLWTNGGITYARKEDGSPIITIDSIEGINQLV